MDVHTREQRHYNMSQIHSKDTKPELIVRKWLWHNGYRYRLHRKDLPGKPDIVLPKYNAIIFVHGCFWHRHNCKFASIPKTRKVFWEQKLNGNVERDKRNVQKLKELNWRILVIWECEIKKWDSNLEKKIEDFLCTGTNILYTIGQEEYYIAAEEESLYADS
jgi:DNA mismatch endonuclease (patch repair protein)